MNSLSWLLYWASVAPHLSNWLCIASFLLFFAGVTCFVLSIVWDAVAWQQETNGYPHGAMAIQKQSKILRRLSCLAPLFFLPWGLSFAVPDKETFYLIAASQTGEQAMHTPEFDKVRLAINNYLDKFTVDEHKDDK